jgi:ribosomal-protein-alanine N-acetyltransferase
MIRLAEENDLDTIIDLSIEAFGIECCFIEEYYLQLINGNISYVIEEDEKVVGFCLNKLKNNKISIPMIAISENFRNRGYGKKLINHLINNHNKQCCSFNLMVDVVNKNALHLYESLGFRRQYTQYKYYENGNDAYYMKLNSVDEI